MAPNGLKRIMFILLGVVKITTELQVHPEIG